MSGENTPVVPAPFLSTPRARWAHRMPAILFFGGLLVVFCYYATAVARGTGGHPALAQPDSLIYMQYARSMAEGHAYVFSPGDAPSTGSTSHLYPFVLAVFFWLGARGDGLIDAIFLLNAGCFLVWLQLFWHVARRVAPAQALLAAGLVLLNGHLALAAMGQTDVTLFLALSWGLLAALLYGRFRWAAVLIFLCALARPEGMVLATMLMGLAAVFAWRRSPLARGFLGAAGAGVLGTIAVLVLNRLLTGMWQFQSISGKGYLNVFPLLGGLGCAARDFLTMLRELLFNVGAEPRSNYFAPVVGGSLAVLGLARLLRNLTPLRGAAFAPPVSRAARVAVLLWWLGCCLAALGLVAMSEFQGLGNDRYLIWVLPTWYLLSAAGVGQVAQWASRRQVAMVLGVALLGMEVATAPFFLARFAAQNMATQAMVTFTRDIHATLPAGAPLGMLEGGGVRYYLGNRPVRQLSGILSPAFRCNPHDMMSAFETLRHEPALRFNAWLIQASRRGWCEETGLLGDCIATDTDTPPDGYGFGVYEANWEAMSVASLLPLDPVATNAVVGLRRVDQLDVGYAPDERRCGYRTGQRLVDVCYLPFVACRKLGTGKITEVGRVVIGWDEFRVAAPGRLQSMRVVLRTALDASCTTVHSNMRQAGEEFHLRSPLRLRLLINGEPLPEMSIPVTCTNDAFAECVLDIPASAVTTDPLEVVIAGDHIACGYWFYQ